VIGAGLLIRSFAELVQVDPGFRTESIITARITPSGSRYDDDAMRRAFYSEVLARVRALPGVRSADAVSRLPLTDGSSGSAFEVEGKPYTPGASAPVFEDRRITPDYPKTMGIRLLQGRALTDADREGTPKVALINETMARTFWPGEDPVGKRFKEVWLREWTTVVGVVTDVKSHGLAGRIEPEVYRPFTQAPSRDMSLVVRTSVEPTTLAALLRAAVASVDAQVPVSEIRTAEQIVSGSVADSRFTTFLLAAFAAVALVLAAVGIYGVIAYTVSQRTREIGVRVALGARGRDVQWQVVRQGGRLALVGIAVGVVASLAAARLLSSLLFGVSTTDPITFVSVALLLGGVAVLASWIPARRAASVDPIIALRAE
jgi:putative ABC transport system permease protein